MPTTIDLIPIEQLVNMTDTYVCSRNLFSFVNRSLNEMGLQARVIDMSDQITFMIDKLRRD
jgi:hypothetical protein